MSEPKDRPGRRRTPWRRLAWLALAVSGLGLIVLVDVPWAQSPAPVSVQIQQLDWLDPAGQIAAANSTAALAEFTFGEAASGLVVGTDGAYVNLYTSIDGGTNYQLAVENLFVQFDTEADMLSSRMTALIDLGNADATEVGLVSYQASLTHDSVDPPGVGTDLLLPGSLADFVRSRQIGIEPPIARLPDPDQVLFQNIGDDPEDITVQTEPQQPAPIFTSTPLPAAPVYVATVQHRGFSFGGFGPGGGLRPPAHPPRPNPWRPVPRPIAPRPLPPPPPPIRPRPLGGVLAPPPVVVESPMSCAPSAIARSIRYMLNIRGRGGQDAQTMMNSLYALMGTSPTAGTTGNNMLNGKNAYAAANGLNITNTPQASVGQAAATLNNGGDVELNILWGNGNCGAGGHVAMVISIVLRPDGNFQVTYVDDFDQHHDNGVNTDYHTIVVQPNGLILSGFPCQPAVVASLLAENMR